MTSKLNIILRVLLLISLVFLLYFLITKKLDNCEVCSFEYDGKVVNGKQFMNIYQKECLQIEKYKKISNISNITSS